MIPFKIWFNQIAFILFTLFNLLYLSYGNEGKSTIQMAKLFSIYVYTLFLWKKFAVNKSILKHSSFSEKFTHKKINESRGLNVFLIYMYIYIHINDTYTIYTYMYSCWDIHISLSIRISTNLLEELNSFLQRHFMNSNFSRLLQIIVKNMQKNLA